MGVSIPPSPHVINHKINPPSLPSNYVAFRRVTIFGTAFREGSFSADLCDPQVGKSRQVSAFRDDLMAHSELELDNL